jgi:hypothetical protein
MAKGKGGSGKTYSSKGERRNVASNIVNSVRKDRNSGEKMLHLQKAWAKGQNPWITIENPNKEEKDKLFIRVRMNDTYLGHPKERIKKMFIMN